MSINIQITIHPGDGVSADYSGPTAPKINDTAKSLILEVLSTKIDEIKNKQLTLNTFGQIQDFLGGYSFTISFKEQTASSDCLAVPLHRLGSVPQPACPKKRPVFDLTQLKEEAPPKRPPLTRGIVSRLRHSQNQEETFQELRERFFPSSSEEFARLQLRF